MRCISCDYELLHCVGRICPECGTDFALHEFIFEEQKVLFHCPHCDHGIVGAKPNGLPPEQIEECESCGLAVGLDMYIVRPISGVSAESAELQLPIHQEEGNWFSRYFKTIGMVMIHPSRAINRVHVQKPLFDAWKFLLTTLIIMVFVGTIPMTLFVSIGMIGQVGSQPNLFAGSLFVLGGQALLYFAVYIIFAVVWGLTAHVMLQLTGGSTFTLRRTMQAILYSSGSIIIGIVPCCGGLASFVWWIVSATNMVKKGQRVHGGRASLAVVMPPLVAVICVCGFYIYIMNSVVGNARAIAATAAANAASRQSTTINPENIPEDELPMEPRSE